MKNKENEKQTVDEYSKKQKIILSGNNHCEFVTDFFANQGLVLADMRGRSIAEHPTSLRLVMAGPVAIAYFISFLILRTGIR